MVHLFFSCPQGLKVSCCCLWSLFWLWFGQFWSDCLESWFQTEVHRVGKRIDITHYALRQLLPLQSIGVYKQQHQAAVLLNYSFVCISMSFQGISLRIETQSWWILLFCFLAAPAWVEFLVFCCKEQGKYTSVPPELYVCPVGIQTQAAPTLHLRISGGEAPPVVGWGVKQKKTKRCFFATRFIRLFPTRYEGRNSWSDPTTVILTLKGLPGRPFSTRIHTWIVYCQFSTCSGYVG